MCLPFPGASVTKSSERYERNYFSSHLASARYAEAAVVVVECDALDDAGDFLGRGSAIWHGGVHSSGLIVPRKARGWVIRQEADLR